MGAGLTIGGLCLLLGSLMGSSSFPLRRDGILNLSIQFLPEETTAFTHVCTCLADAFIREKSNGNQKHFDILSIYFLDEYKQNVAWVSVPEGMHLLYKLCRKSIII